ncbi:MAG: DUF72 domain-containing protein [Dehalococcoidia bacterium]
MNERVNKHHIGTSGWHYDHWREVFYPPELPKKKWFDFYSRHFSTVELNNSFYRLPSENTFANWRDSSPPGFLFAVKASRFITHVKRLKNLGDALATFLSRADILQDRLGPLLYQLPPNINRDEDRLESFLSSLPSGYQHVFEFRNESWFQDSVFERLRRHNVGFCIYDMPDFTTPLVATAGFAYIRFHGSTLMYGGSYPDDELERWAQSIGELSQGLTSSYIYFNNDIEGFAVKNAKRLDELLQ